MIIFLFWVFFVIFVGFFFPVYVKHHTNGVSTIPDHHSQGHDVGSSRDPEWGQSRRNLLPGGPPDSLPENGERDLNKPKLSSGHLMVESCVFYCFLI